MDKAVYTVYVSDGMGGHWSGTYASKGEALGQYRWLCQGMAASLYVTYRGLSCCLRSS